MFRTKEINRGTELQMLRVEETCDGETLGGQIEVVQEFCYLGDVLDCEAVCREHFVVNI